MDVRALANETFSRAAGALLIEGNSVRLLRDARENYPARLNDTLTSRATSFTETTRALDSLAEALLKTERGGAVAVWASTGMTNPKAQAGMNRDLYRLVFGAGTSGMRLGDMTARAKAVIGDRDIRVTWC